MIYLELLAEYLKLCNFQLKKEKEINVHKPYLKNIYPFVAHMFLLIFSAL